MDIYIVLDRDYVLRDAVVAVYASDEIIYSDLEKKYSGDNFIIVEDYVYNDLEDF